MLREFQKFLLRGNVVDLAVGVVIGSAFGAVVNALVSDLLTPFIAAIVKVPDFSDLYFALNGSKFMYGHLLNAVISFLLVAIAIFFFIVKPVNALMAKARRGEAPQPPSTKKCPQCLSDVPINAKRCAHCTELIESGT